MAVPAKVTCITTLCDAPVVRRLAPGVHLVLVAEDGSCSAVQADARGILTPTFYLDALIRNDEVAIALCAANGVTPRCYFDLPNQQFSDEALLRRIFNAGETCITDKVASAIAEHTFLGLLGDLIKRGIGRDNMKNIFGKAILSNNMAVAEMCLANVADPKTSFLKEKTPDKLPLHVACELGHLPMVKLLIKHGADINSPYRDIENGALYFAAGNGRHEVVAYLLEQGVDVHSGNSYGRDLAIRVAAARGCVPTARILLDHGADVHAKTDESDEHPLFQAVDCSQLDMVKFLIERGANIIPAVIAVAQGDIRKYLDRVIIAKKIDKIMSAARLNNTEAVLDIICE